MTGSGPGYPLIPKRLKCAGEEPKCLSLGWNSALQLIGEELDPSLRRDDELKPFTRPTLCSSFQRRLESSFSCSSFQRRLESGS